MNNLSDQFNTNVHKIKYFNWVKFILKKGSHYVMLHDLEPPM